METKSKLATVVYPVQNGMILTGVKRRTVGVGRRNGFGGVKNPEESIRACATRETREECGIEIDETNLQFRGIIDFYNHEEKGDGTPFIRHFKVWFYLVETWEGWPTEQPKEAIGQLMWLPVNSELLSNMMRADREFLPRMLQGEILVGEYHYSSGQEEFFKEAVNTLQPAKKEVEWA